VAVEGRGHLGGHHRAQHRGAERAADLHGGLLEPGRDAGQPDRRVADDHLGGAHDHAAIATTLTLADSVPALFAANLRRLAEWEDTTFGAQQVFVKAPAVGNAAPSTEFQFFGQVSISAETRALTVHLRDNSGAVLRTKDLSRASALACMRGR
jgi:hypothetical protein